MTRSRIALVATITGAGLLAACSDSGSDPSAFSGPVAHISQGCPNVPIQGQVQLCVDGSDGTFVVTSPTSNVSLTLVNDAFATVLDNPSGKNQTANAVLTSAPAGTVTDSIVVLQGRARLRSDPLTVSKTLVTGTVAASAFAGRESGALIVYYNH